MPILFYKEKTPITSYRSKFKIIFIIFYFIFYSHYCKLFLVIYTKTIKISPTLYLFALLQKSSHYCKLYFVSFLYKVERLISNSSAINSLSLVEEPYSSRYFSSISFSYLSTISFKVIL